MARHMHKPNIPPGELDMLRDGFPMTDDRNFGIGPLLKEHSMKEDRILKIRR